MGEFTMRCLSCNEILTDFESTRKSVSTNQYIDMCNRCYFTISDDVAALERADLAHDDDDLSQESDTEDIDFDKYE